MRVEPQDDLSLRLHPDDDVETPEHTPAKKRGRRAAAAQNVDPDVETR